jgi:hypothetical protein
MSHHISSEPHHLWWPTNSVMSHHIPHLWWAPCLVWPNTFVISHYICYEPPTYITVQATHIWYEPNQLNISSRCSESNARKQITHPQKVYTLRVRLQLCVCIYLCVVCTLCIRQPLEKYSHCLVCLITVEVTTGSFFLLISFHRAWDILRLYIHMYIAWWVLFIYGRYKKVAKWLRFSLHKVKRTRK